MQNETANTNCEIRLLFCLFNVFIFFRYVKSLLCGSHSWCVSVTVKWLDLTMDSVNLIESAFESWNIWHVMACSI